MKTTTDDMQHFHSKTKILGNSDDNCQADKKSPKQCMCTFPIALLLYTIIVSQLSKSNLACFKASNGAI